MHRSNTSFHALAMGLPLMAIRGDEGIPHECLNRGRLGNA
jgi:hypothetical protein